jgi:hypothetical protein
MVGHEAVIARFDAYPELMHDSLRATIQNCAIQLQRYVKEDALSGQILHNRTGNLRRSINFELSEVGNNISASVGTNVEYAAAHEYGFDGEVTVRASIRRTRDQMAAATYHYTNKNVNVISKIKQTGKYGTQSGTINVRSFTRHQHTVERSFLRSSLQVLARDFQQQMAESIKSAMK